MDHQAQKETWYVDSIQFFSLWVAEVNTVFFKEIQNNNLQVDNSPICVFSALSLFVCSSDIVDKSCILSFLWVFYLPTHQLGC